MRVNTMLKDITHWCVVPPSGDEVATPDLQSDVLTTRPTRVKSHPRVLKFLMGAGVGRKKLIAQPYWDVSR
jgi:hypothetical protein